MRFAIRRPSRDDRDRKSARRGTVAPARAEGAEAALAPWEALVTDAVGNVIEFWGFKRNQGRVWALLYLRSTPMSAAEIQGALGLSKGAVSMLTRDLEQWRVLTRVRRPSDPVWRFEAGTDLLAMIGGVLEARESAFVARVKEDLAEAERQVRAAPGVDPAVVDRVARMRILADRVEDAVRVLARTARLDVRGVVDVLQHSVGGRLLGGRR